MEILKAEPSQASELQKLDVLSRNSPWSLRQWQLELVQANQLNLILVENARIRSGIFGRIYSDEVEVFMILTHPDFRKKGYAKFLLSQCLTQAKASEREVLLEVSQHNHAALNLYRSVGLRVIGIRKKYYSDGSDAMLMKS